MKQPVEKRKPQGLLDYLALGLTTFGVGYIPGAPGTYGSIVAVGIYMIFTGIRQAAPVSGMGTAFSPDFVVALIVGFPHAVYLVLLALFSSLGVWASGRAIALLGNSDPPEAVVDEVMGQLLTFAFVPFGLGWPFILAGFLLFRLFDIWKPFPIDRLQDLPGGLGICADDIVAGVYAGTCLAIGYAVYLSAMRSI